MSSKENLMEISTTAGNLCQVFSVFFAIAVRLVLSLFCILTVMVLVDERNDSRYWALTAILSLMIVEGCYTVKTRHGQERKWVCLCFVCYLLASVPSIWLLELQKLGVFRSRLAEANATSLLTNLPGGLTTNIELESDEIIFIMENCLVFLLILCRWLLPRGEITRDQLSQLLFVFIGMASDVMELFQLFEEDEIKQNRILTYIILTVWTVSLLQFTLVLTMSANPKKARVASPNGRSEGTGGKKIMGRTMREYIWETEIWSLMITIMMQDGPYLAVRLYVVIELGVINSTSIFFVLKNSIVILLLAYRLCVVYLLLSEDDETGSKSYGMRGRSRSLDVLSETEETSSQPSGKATPRKGKVKLKSIKRINVAAVTDPPIHDSSAETTESPGQASTASPVPAARKESPAPSQSKAESHDSPKSERSDNSPSPEGSPDTKEPKASPDLADQNKSPTPSESRTGRQDSPKSASLDKRSVSIGSSNNNAPTSFPAWADPNNSPTPSMSETGE